MKITSEPLENKQVKLTIEVEQPEMDKYLEVAYQHLVSRVRVPGFRKGKTPRNILENMIGKEALLEEAIEHAVPEIYEKAVMQENIAPIARPKIEVTKIDPVSFTAIVPLQPNVELGDYKSVRIEHSVPEVEEKEVEASLKQVQYQQSTLTPVDRPAELEDVVTIDIAGEEQGKPLPLRKDQVYELNKDNPLPLPGFAEKLAGITKGEEKSFSISYPEGYDIKELVGKEYSFIVKASEIKKRELPEINDDLAKTAGFASLDEMKQKINEQLKMRNEQRANNDLEQKIMEKLAEISKVEFPPVLAEVEIDSIIEEEAKNFPDGVKGLEKYLESLNKPMEEHRKEIEPIATRKVMNSLLLNKVSEVEEVKAEETEIQAEIDNMPSQSEEEKANIRKLFEMPQPRNSLEQYIIRRKTISSLKGIVTGKNS
jgi:trigger factor